MRENPPDDVRHEPESRWLPICRDAVADPGHWQRIPTPVPPSTGSYLKRQMIPKLVARGELPAGRWEGIGRSMNAAGEPAGKGKAWAYVRYTPPA